MVGVQNEDVDGIEGFGKKFIGVKAGGSLEVHGKDKKSWSMLAKTLVPHEHAYQLETDPGFNNVHLYKFDRATGEKVWSTEESGAFGTYHKLRRDAPDLEDGPSVTVMVSR